jgi:rubrerythrin
MYPGFIKTATAEKQAKAVKTFNYAMKVEEGHAKLYATALADLKGWKADGSFFVCQVCGNTVEKIDFSKCPVCFESKREYKEVK